MLLSLSARNVERRLGHPATPILVRNRTRTSSASIIALCLFSEIENAVAGNTPSASNRVLPVIGVRRKVCVVRLVLCPRRFNDFDNPCLCTNTDELLASFYTQLCPNVLKGGWTCPLL